MLRSRIPACRMKMREMHIVPLSRQALAVLGQLKQINGHRDFVFPNARNPYTCISAGNFNHALLRMGFAGDDTIASARMGCGRQLAPC